METKKDLKQRICCKTFYVIRMRKKVYGKIWFPYYYSRAMHNAYVVFAEYSENSARALWNRYHSDRQIYDLFGNNLCKKKDKKSRKKSIVCPLVDCRYLCLCAIWITITMGSSSSSIHNDSIPKVNEWNKNKKSFNWCSIWNK